MMWDDSKKILITSLVVASVSLIPNAILFLSIYGGGLEILGLIFMWIPNALLTIPVIICLVSGLRKGEFPEIRSTLFSFALIAWSIFVIVVSVYDFLHHLI